jgi:uncharacterized protein
MIREQNEDMAHDYDHLIRVMAFAEHIHMYERGDLPTIWAAVAFHDVGKERERRCGGDHAVISANIAKELLSNTPFPQHAILGVWQAIEEHRMTAGKTPGTLEGRILYDADKLDILGAIGIARLFCITGQYKQKVYSFLPANFQYPVDPAQVRLLRQDASYAPNLEFQLLFNDLPRRMMTRTGRKLAQERYDYMARFFTRLQMEVAGLL